MVRLAGLLVSLAVLPFGSPSLLGQSLSVADLVKQVKPAVVYVATFDERGQQDGFGSGFVVDASGLIVTNLHVLAGSASASIRMADGEIYDRVEVLDYDARRDLAIIKVRPFKPLPVAALGDSDAIDVGDEAIAVGNPQGLEHTVSSGLISGFRQSEGFREIQISAPISPGSSGGPLFNRQGRVIGVTSAAIVSQGAQNLNFAIPINYVKPMLGSTSPPISLVEMNRRLTHGPSSGRAAAEGAGAAGPLVDWYANAAHDHQSGDFSQFCLGRLYVRGDLVGYATPDGTHNWEVPFGAVKEIKKNLFAGSQHQAFHITLKTGSNYNLVILDEATPIAPDAVIFRLMEALQRAR